MRRPTQAVADRAARMVSIVRDCQQSIAYQFVVECTQEQMWAFLDVTGELWEEQRLADVQAVLTTSGRTN